MTPDNDPVALRGLLDKIHDIAAKAGTVEGIPSEVDEALSKIISLARYKLDVLPREKR